MFQPNLRGLSNIHVVLCVLQILSSSMGMESAEYGVDVSFPIHGYIKDKTSVFYKRYQETMAGCYNAYSQAACDATEHARIAMNREQPKSQHNYTEIGFKKTRVPDALFEEIIRFYEANKDQSKIEHWPPGNTYVNNWISPPTMISFEDQVCRCSHLYYTL